MPPKSIFRQPGAKHFQLVHRSQRDPLIHDPDASKHVLKPIERANAKKGQSRTDLESVLPSSEVAHDASAKVGEAALYGVYYDDTEYNYLQHLRAVGEQEDGVESILIEAPSSSNSQKLPTKKAKGVIQIRDLPEDVLASNSELKMTYESQQAIPDSISGLQPSMDPHLRQALEALEDDAFVNHDLEDDFFSELVEDGERGSDEEVDFGFEENDDDEFDAHTIGDEIKKEDRSGWEDHYAQFKQASKQIQDSDSEYESEGGDTVGRLPTPPPVVGQRKRRKGASDASGYSMSSSSMYRNEALQTLDKRFDQMMISQYAEEEEHSPLSEEDNESDEAPELLTSREDFDSMMDEFLINYEILGRKMKLKLDGDTGTEKLDTVRRALGQGDELRLGSLGINDDDDVLMPLDIYDKADRWDCETILTTYSNVENHPRLIRARDMKPAAQIRLDPKTGFPLMGSLPNPKVKHGRSQDKIPSLQNNTPTPQTTARPRDESREDKKTRKSAVKTERHMRRINKKLVKEKFGGELKTQKRVTENTEGKVKKL